VTSNETLNEIVEAGKRAEPRPWLRACGRSTEAVVTENRKYDSVEQVRYAGSPIADCDTNPHCGSTEQQNQDNAEYIALAANHADHLAAELLRLRAERTWQPIDKAPQDGTEFLGYWDNDDLHVVSIRAGQCYRQMDREAWAMPTLWMPLPELPDEARELAEILK
jgi:hypothetical protein